MLDLDRALTDIRAMKSQIARGTEFRGYGPATFAASAAAAIVAALVQSWWVPEPTVSISRWLALWIIAAVLSGAVIAADVITRARRVHCGLADEMVQAAAEHMVPPLIAGALLTAVLVRFAPETTWMLPGLWQILLSLGIFASCRLLPTPMIAVAVWYLGAGLACLAYANGDDALAPWTMGLPFGIGQLLSAALIQITGRGDDKEP